MFAPRQPLNFFSGTQTTRQEFLWVLTEKCRLPTFPRDVGVTPGYRCGPSCSIQKSAVRETSERLT